MVKTFDSIEIIQEKETTKAFGLLDRIMSDLNAAKFSLRDVENAFNTFAEKNLINNDQYRQEDLEILQELGVIEELPGQAAIEEPSDDSKIYRIVQDSPIIIQRDMNLDMEHYD